MTQATPRRSWWAAVCDLGPHAGAHWTALRASLAIFVPLVASAGSGNLRPGDGGGALDHLSELGVGGVPVPPGDVAADHAGLLAVGGVVGAVEGEVAQRGELRLDPVEPGAVERGVGDLDVVRLRPPADPVVGAGGQVRAEVVADDREPHSRRIE